ncbi:putative aspartate aminotransferase, cytoplasmic 2 isoform X1 [Sarcophilus harrisii]|uniref:aspartate transaminase n=1 Tax=Sarcophilus harrisii TaxID=9305 RepID=A0A7N4Q086_SARHA|nr:putative aspartate aminotransferase, cytoplasmic 2 isoform X1 [Sarcophilus harrisii]
MPTLSVFLDVPLAPKTTSKLLDDFQQDEDPNKVYLGYGVCMTGEKIPWLSPVVTRTLRRLIHDPSFSYTYLPEHGLEAFIRVATELLVGRHSPAIAENRIGGVHTIGGNGAILLGAKFLKDWHRGPRVVYMQQTQREQYGPIFQELGFSLREYTFWDTFRLVSDTGKLFDVVEHAPDRSILVLYNSGSFILPRKRWFKLSKLLKKKQIFLFCDIPDQGLVSGDPDMDNKILRYLVAQGFEFFCSQSLSNSFGLHDERVGNLVVVTVSNKSLLCIRSQLDIYARYMWGSPPALGSRVITTILSNPALRMEWKKSLRSMVENIMLTREKMKEKLRLLCTPGSWEHLTGQDGMYSFLGITVEQVDYLVTKKHIYIPMNGLINFTCINYQNIDYITQSINEAILTIGPGPQPKDPPKTEVMADDPESKNLGHMTSESKSLGLKAPGLSAYLHNKK